MKEFAVLTAKTYSYLTDNNDEFYIKQKTQKSVKKITLKV